MPDPLVTPPRLRQSDGLGLPGPDDTVRRDGWRAAALPSTIDRFRAPFRDWTPRDAWSAVAVLVAVVLFLLPASILGQQSASQAAVAAREAAGYTPPPLPTATPAAGPITAVLADETADRASTGVTASERWPALLGSRLKADVTTIAADGSGYVTTAGSGRTFVGAAARVPSDAEVVLVVGGANDALLPAAVLGPAAAQAIAAVHQRAPGAVVALVGPVVTNGLSAGPLATLRGTLSAAAAAAGATWVDPIGSKWLPTVRLRAADLTASDERTIASRLVPVVGGMLP